MENIEESQGSSQVLLGALGALTKHNHEFSRQLRVMTRALCYLPRPRKVLDVYGIRRYLREYDIELRRRDVPLQNTFSRDPRPPRILHFKEHHKILLRFLPEAIVWDHIYPFQKRVILITRGVGEITFEFLEEEEDEPLIPW